MLLTERCIALLLLSLPPPCMQVSFSPDRAVIEGDSLSQAFAADISVQVWKSSNREALSSVPKSAPLKPRRVLSHDSFSVTFGYDLDGGIGSVELPLVKGSPYVTAIFRGDSKALLTTVWGISSVTTKPFFSESDISDRTKSSSVPQTRKASTNLGSECNANAGCANLGLDGACCPTAAGVNLGCCASEDRSSNGESATTPSSLVGDSYFVTLTNGQKWVMYVLGAKDGATLRWAGQAMWLDFEVIVGDYEVVVVRLARVLDALRPGLAGSQYERSTTTSVNGVGGLALLSKHRWTFPTGGSLRWGLLGTESSNDELPSDSNSEKTRGSEDTGRVIFDWNSTYMGHEDNHDYGLLMVALPHHFDAMARLPQVDGPSSPYQTMCPALSMPSLKGVAVAVVGATWTMDYKVNVDQNCVVLNSFTP